MSTHRSSPRTGTPQSIGTGLPYADLAEDRVLHVIESAKDRRDGSAELERGITDWPTRYHLDRRRANLLRPFTIAPSCRVLEIGAGCGALSRFLGETGAEVVCLEGSPARARAVQARCNDLDNVTVLSGDLADFEDAEGFDLAVVVGVLEYAATEAGGGLGPTAFLERVQGLLREAGAMLLAVENQLGLRYLLGCAEDHLGTPWTGVAGYPGTEVRTWSRRALTDLLTRHGFDRQHWFFPFPSYKLPRTVLAEAAYHHDAELVDQLVGSPADDDERGEVAVVDERAAHRVCLGAALGPDLANAFLVWAGGRDADPASWFDPDTLAWMVSDRRQHGCRRIKAVRRDSETGGLHVVSQPLQASTTAAPPAAIAGWLHHRPTSSTPWVVGRTLEQQARDACRRADLDALDEVLRTWSTHLSELTTASKAPDTAHPFLDRRTRVLLPPPYLDVDLANFVQDVTGALRYIDDEWHAEGGVDFDLVRLRALWHLAVDLVRNRSATPWHDEHSVASLTTELAARIELSATETDLERLWQAEASAQAAITGEDDTSLASTLMSLASWTGPRHALLASYEQESDQLRGELSESYDRQREMGDKLEGLQGAFDQERRAAVDFQARVYALQEELSSSQEELSSTYDRLREAGEKLEALQGAPELVAAYDRQRVLGDQLESLAAAYKHAHTSANDLDVKNRRLLDELEAAYTRIRVLEGGHAAPAATVHDDTADTTLRETG